MRASKLYQAIFSIVFLFTPIASLFGQEIELRPTVSQWIKPSETGLFECQVVIPSEDGQSIGLSNARVEVTGHNARKAIAITDKAGIATIPGITPGDYTLTVWGKGYVAWQSLHFLALDDDRFGGTPSQAVITPAAIDLELFEKMATPYISGSPSLDENTDINPEATPSDKIKGVYMPEIMLTNGGLAGIIVAKIVTSEESLTSSEIGVAENHLVFVIDRDQHVRQTVTNEKGEFFAENVSAGLHSVIVVGRLGIVASRIVVIDPKDAATSQMINEQGKRYVASMEIEEKLRIELTPDYDDCGNPRVKDGGIIPPLAASSGGSTGNLIGTALLGTAAAVGTSAYTASAADSESTELGGI